jgi:cyclohexa-1,5-dienecarbonyl-CoA hydratase
MSKVDVRLEQDDTLARVVLNAPKGNILDAAMIEDLTAASRDVARRPTVKLMVLEGAGPHFSFGASVEEHRREPCRAMIPQFGRLFLTWIEAAVPTLAAVRGQCLGGGMEVALFCNWVIAHPQAKFGQPEIRLGVFPPVAALMLPLLAGQPAADDLCLTGRTIGAQEALEMRLVHSLAEDVEDAAQKFFATHLRPLSAAALRLAVRASRQQFNRTFRELWPPMERLYLEELMGTHDANEGIEAFIAKRPPVWAHR